MTIAADVTFRIKMYTCFYSKVFLSITSMMKTYKICTGEGTV